MNSLVQIIPALRQSGTEVAACPKAYVAIHVEGKVQPDSIPSERGSEIHWVMSEYVRHCGAACIAADWPKFNELAKAAGPVAGPILDGIRDNYEVDWRRVYGTEITLALDEDFRPAYRIPQPDGSVIEIDKIPGVHYSEKLAAYTGILDVVLISECGTRAKNDDYKSHPAPFDADTFQSKLYAFMLMKHLPKLESVKFELNFVRYVNCRRSVTWKREQMPEMQAAISRARERQRALHQDPSSAKAIPCTVCVYCPLAKDFSCPIAEWNEYTIHSPQTRLQWKVWLAKMAAINNPILKAHAEVDGPVRYEDGNGRVYEYGELPVPSTRYPLDATTLHVLNEFSDASGDDWRTWNLNISSTTLKQKLKAKKRAALSEAFEESIIETETKPKWAVRTPEGMEPDFNPYAGNE